MKKPVPARVHIILARDSDTAIVIRRGPSNAVCTMLWDRRKDTFKLGQWLRGRIYERRCDLSPDGRHFIYFAMNGRWDGPLKGSWTAISKAPYLKAIGLWAKGDCWHGGGLFLDKRSYWLNGSGLEQRQFPSQLVHKPEFPFHESYGGECRGVQFIQLQRDGWKLVGHDCKKEVSLSFFEKKLTQSWVLRKTARAGSPDVIGKGCYFDWHSLHNHRTGQVIECPDWEWADLDGRRVVWVSAGILYAAKLTGDRLMAQKALHDFNGMKFEAVPAPY